MRNLSNNIVAQVNKDDMSYIQFNILNKYGIKNAYSLNVGDWNYRHSNLEEEKAAYEKLCNYVGLKSNLVSKPFQRHTDKVLAIDKAMVGEEIGEVDGLITNKKDIVLATTNADCILYLLFDKEKRIIENGINLMVEKYDSNPKDIIVCICPSIRKCCFEVDADVKDMFANKFSFFTTDDYPVCGKSRGYRNANGVNWRYFWLFGDFYPLVYGHGSAGFW